MVSTIAQIINHALLSNSTKRPVAYNERVTLKNG